MKNLSQSLLPVLVLVTLASSFSFGQITPPPDQPDSTSSKKDSARVIDSVLTAGLQPPEDSTYLLNYYNLNDSISAYFLIDRLDLSNESNRSFQHDAADFVRFNPSNFIIEYQNTPVRKTVSPFALPGNRINVIFNHRSLNPLEHLPEADNMIDFNDVPTAPVQGIYNIEGPLGMVFGGKNSTSSTILFPRRPDTTRAESELVVDKGWYGYAYTKALFANQNPDGRSIRIAAGYRKAIGAYPRRDDDAYHQWGEIVHPIREKVRLTLSGRLYRRKGTYPVRPGVADFYLNRFRRDRDLTASVEIGHSATQKSTIEFRHQRSESKVDRPFVQYYRGLDILNNSLTISHERKLGPAGMKISTLFSHEAYNDAGTTHKRWHGFVDTKFLFGTANGVMLSYFKIEKVEGYDPAPSAALIYTRNNKRVYFSGSIGYSTKVPRQYELYLVPRLSQIIATTGSDYFESGNSELKSEKQLIGNVTLGLGKIGSDMILSATGGKIFDGIDWQRIDTLDLDFAALRTGNKDIEFANITLRQRLSWDNRLTWSGGGSYHHVKVDGNDNLAYSPDYQAFSNLELYYYIKRLELHLYGYTEVIYSGAYVGYHGEELGNNVILNSKLSFRIKKFRFYYVFQNFPSIIYRSREDYTIPGSFNYYGISWEFLD